MKRVILIITVICLIALNGCVKDESVKKDRSPWEIECGRGSEYMHLGDYEKAVESFTAAIEIDPEKAEAYISRAEAYTATGESGENLLLALVDYEKAISIGVSDQTLLYMNLDMAEIHIRLGNDEKASAILHKISESQKSEVTSGTCGDDLRWTLADGVLTISGSGPMNDFGYHAISTDGYGVECAPWSGRITDVVIEDGVTSIGWYAFEDCYSLKTVTIPESVTSIGSYAFMDCMLLESVVMPEGITRIDMCTLFGCDSLKEVIIPENVTNIGWNAFEGCYSLETVTIPDGVTEIGPHAFGRCYSLETITIPSSVTEISSYAFERWTSKQTIYLEGRTSPPEEWDPLWLKDCSAQVVCEK